MIFVYLAFQVVVLWSFINLTRVLQYAFAGAATHGIDMYV